MMKKILVIMLSVLMLLGTVAQAAGALVYESYSPTQAVMDDIEAQFEEENPDIELDTIMFANANDYFSQVQIAFASGDGPDVFQYDTPTRMAQYIDLLEPLDDYCQATWGDDWKSLFNPSALESNTIDGKLYGLPCPAAPAGTIWYNKTLLDEVGVDVPTDYDSLKAAADALRAAGYQPMLLGAKDSWANLDYFQVILNDFAPGLQYDAFEGKASFNDPLVVEAFAMWKKLFDEGIIQDSAYSMTVYMDTYTQFNEQGIGGLCLNGAWNMDMYTNPDITEEVAKREWGIALMPDLNGDGEQPGLLNVFGGYCISKDSKNKEDAWKLLVSMGTGYGLLKEVQRSMAPSPYLAMEEVTFDIPENAVLNLAQIDEISNAKPMSMRGVDNTAISEAILEALEAVAYGQITPEEAAANVDAVIQENL